jgi:ribosomal protein L7/L12
MMPEFIGEVLRLLVEMIIRVFSEDVYRKERPRLAPERFAALSALLRSRDELESLLKQKKKISAIKLFRQETGADLKEAKLAVEQIEEELYREEYVVLLADHQEQRVELESLLRAGHKIAAIKRYRQITGLELRQAKRDIEEMQIGLRPLSAEELHAKVDNVDALQSLLQSGNKLQAIKLYRQSHGVGLKEAKEAVEALVVGNVPPQHEKQFVDPDKLQQLLRNKQKIAAIKYYRICTGVGLKEAKEAVEWLEKGIVV